MKKYLLSPLTTIAFFFVPKILMAQDVTINISPATAPGLRIIQSPGNLISATVSVILIVAALAAFIYLIIGGFRWITSSGDKAGIDAARNQIQAALLGLFIVFGAWAFMLIIQAFFGVTILGNIQIPTPFGNTNNVQQQNECIKRCESNIDTYDQCREACLR